MLFNAHIISMSDKDPSPDFNEDTSLKDIVEMPRLYRVLMHNDHFTTMDFVVEMLMRFFNKGEEEAVRIMLDVHKKGIGMCGVYTYDIAQTKISQVADSAKSKGYPLMCSMEEN